MSKEAPLSQSRRDFLTNPFKSVIAAVQTNADGFLSENPQDLLPDLTRREFLQLAGVGVVHGVLDLGPHTPDKPVIPEQSGGVYLETERELSYEEVKPYLPYMRNTGDMVLSELLPPTLINTLSKEQVDTFCSALAKVQAKALIEHYGRDQSVVVGINPEGGFPNTGGTLTTKDQQMLSIPGITMLYARKLATEISASTNGKMLGVVLRPEVVSNEATGGSMYLTSAQKRMARLLQVGQAVQNRLPGRDVRTTFLTIAIDTQGNSATYFPNERGLSNKTFRDSSEQLAKKLHGVGAGLITSYGIPVNSARVIRDQHDQIEQNILQGSGPLIVLGSKQLTWNLSETPRERNVIELQPRPYEATLQTMRKSGGTIKGHFSTILVEGDMTKMLGWLKPKRREEVRANLATSAANALLADFDPKKTPVIFLDPGHGGVDQNPDLPAVEGGKVRESVETYELVTAIAQRIAEVTKGGARVVITRPRVPEDMVSNVSGGPRKIRAAMQERFAGSIEYLDQLRKQNPGRDLDPIFASFHFNHHPSIPNGTQVFFSGRKDRFYQKGKNIATAMLQSILRGFTSIQYPAKGIGQFPGLPHGLIEDDGKTYGFLVTYGGNLDEVLDRPTNGYR